MSVEEESVEDQMEEIEIPNYPDNYDCLAERFTTSLDKFNITPETYKKNMIIDSGGYKTT